MKHPFEFRATALMQSVKWLQPMFWACVVIFPLATGLFHMPPDNAAWQRKVGAAFALLGYVLLAAQIGSRLRPPAQRQEFISRGWLCGIGCFVLALSAA